MPAQRTDEQIAELLKARFRAVAGPDVAMPSDEVWLGYADAIKPALTRAREAGAESMRERAATIAQGDAVAERYVTWPGWNPGGNRGRDSDAARLGSALATTIRALTLTEVIPDGK